MVTIITYGHPNNFNLYDVNSIVTVASQYDRLSLLLIA